MEIAHVEAVPFALPVRRDFRWAGLGSGVGRFVLVRVVTGDGREGLGEATPLPDWGGDHQRRGGETQQTVVHVVRDLLAPALVGADPRCVAARRAEMDRLVRGHSYAKAAVEMALQDLLGKAAGMPLHRLWGGPVRERVPVAHMVGLMPPDEAVEEAARAVAEGVGGLQVKGGVDPERDVEVVTRIRERTGPGVLLRLDANQGYGRPKQALGVLDRLAGVLDLVEQPVEGLAQMAAVTAASRVEVVADESCWDRADALEVVAADAADLVSVYLAKAGGLDGARAVATVIGAAGRRCDVNGSLESGVGNAANVQFALAVPECTLPCVIPVTATAEAAATEVAGRYYADDIVTEPFGFAAGGILPLERPGLGVTIDEAKLARYRQD